MGESIGTFNRRASAPKLSPRKQELLNKFFWLTQLVLSDRRFDRVINTPLLDLISATRTAYIAAMDDQSNYEMVYRAYQRLETGLMEAGIDVETDMLAMMKRSGYNNFLQMKPLDKRVEAAIASFDK